MSDDDPLPDNEFVAEPEEAEQPSAQRTEDAASPRRYRSKKRKAEIERREGENFWKRCLNDPAGRRELFRFLQSCHFAEDRFACGPNGFPQPEATWFQAGEKSVGERLFHSLCVLDREHAFLMLDEHDPRYAARRIPEKDE